MLDDTGYALIAIDGTHNEDNGESESEGWINQTQRSLSISRRIVDLQQTSIMFVSISNQLLLK